MKWQFTILVMVLSCSSKEKEIELVSSVVKGIIEADNRSDLEQVVSYYHANAVLYPPGKPEIRGLNAIRSNYESIFATSKLQINIEVHHVYVEHDRAVVSGLNTGKRTSNEDQVAVEINDPFVMILTKESGKWKIRELRWN